MNALRRIALGFHRNALLAVANEACKFYMVNFIVL